MTTPAQAIDPVADTEPPQRHEARGDYSEALSHLDVHSLQLTRQSKTVSDLLCELHVRPTGNALRTRVEHAADALKEIERACERSRQALYTIAACAEFL